MQTNTNNNSDIIAEINIIPFVDVILVILIIFLIVSPTLNRPGYNIVLPKAETAEMQKNVKALLSIDIEGIIYLNKKPIKNKVLVKHLDMLLKKDKNMKVVIAADKNVAHGNVMSLINFVKKTGVTKFAVSVESNQ